MMFGKLFVSDTKLHENFGSFVVFAYVSENFSKRAGIKHDGVTMTLGELHPSAFSVIKLPGLVNNSRYVLYGVFFFFFLRLLDLRRFRMVTD